MNVLAIVSIVLPLLRGVLGSVTKSGLPAEIIDSLGAAITNLELVHNDPVTRDQLDALRVEVPW